MKSKILDIVREAMHTHLSWDYKMEEITGEESCMAEISAELDKILRKPTLIELSELDIAKMESCGFRYDRERCLMLKTEFLPDNNISE
jgi:hypothetical protein